MNERGLDGDRALGIMLIAIGLVVFWAGVIYLVIKHLGGK